MSDVVECLTELNQSCEDFCLDESNWSKKWVGRGPAGGANFRLLYSSPETFEQPNQPMILGSNPGGGPENADRHGAWIPFGAPGYSAYLDDFWGKDDRGEHPIQRAAKSVAAAIHGSRPGADKLLRRIPTGNLIPYRSETLGALPDDQRKRGLHDGLKLIDLAQPSLLVFLSSNRQLWDAVMEHLGHPPKPDWDTPVAPNYTVREAQCAASGRGFLVWALPALNTGQPMRTAPRKKEVLAIFRQRLSHHGIAH